MAAVEFRYGQFKTYQVALSTTAKVAGPDIAKVLRDADTCAKRTVTEAVPSWAPGIEIRRAEDVRFG